MRWFIVLLVLGVLLFPVLLFTSTTPVTTSVTTPVEAATPPDGSVIFWDGGFLVNPIERRTGSRLTHSAVVLNGMVYEAVPPCVHRVPFADYMEELKVKSQKRSDFSFFILSPKKPYTNEQVLKMVLYGDSQLGRLYMLRGYGKRVTRGVFCSQLVANVLERGGQIRSADFWESPGSLHKKLKPIYQ